MVAKFTCDTDFLIQSYDANACTLLKCDNRELCNKCITVLMSPFIANLHKQYFDILRKSSTETRVKYAFHIARNMTNASTFVIYDVHKQPILCKINVTLSEDLSSIIHIDKQTHNLTSIPNAFVDNFCIDGSLKVQKYHNTVCVMMDIANSTDFVNRSGDPLKIAELYYDIYKIAKNSVLQYYPYIYIHELLGDSIFLIVNAPFMIKKKYRCSTKIALDVSMQLQKEVDELLKRNDKTNSMHLRVGIAQGDIAAGVFDGRNLRAFGRPINLSQRLESLCEKGNINVASDVSLENINSYDTVYHTYNIKGFGTMAYLSIRNAS